MEAKDKAFELFNKYYQYDITIIGIDSRLEERGISLYDAKKLALICVDELIEYTDWTEVNYWLEVKQELEKL